MSGINRVLIIGHVLREPKIVKLHNGTVVSNFVVCTVAKWPDKVTNKILNHVEKHQIVMYGKLAEVSKNLFKIGSHICIEGYIRTRRFIDKDGIDRAITEIVAKEFNLVNEFNEEIEFDEVLEDEQREIRGSYREEESAIL